MIKVVIGEILDIQILPGHRIRRSGVTVANGFAERIFINDVLEKNFFVPLLHFRCRGEFQSENRFQFRNRVKTRRRPVVMGLIHNDDKVIETGKILIKAFAQNLVNLLHSAIFGVKFRNVEDIDIHFGVIGCSDRAFVLVIVIKPNTRLFVSKYANALENVLLVIWVRIAKIVFEFLINRQTWSDYEEILHALIRIKIGDKSAHQFGLADTCSQGKSKRHKRVIEPCEDGVVVINLLSRGHQIGIFGKLDSA